MNSFWDQLLGFSFGNLLQRGGNMLVWILLFGGYYSLRFDAGEMALKNFQREEQWSKNLGWLQLGAALVLLIAKKVMVYFF